MLLLYKDFEVDTITSSMKLPFLFTLFGFFSFHMGGCREMNVSRWSCMKLDEEKISSWVGQRQVEPKSLAKQWYRSFFTYILLSLLLKRLSQCKP
jgi:hypothetical protein